MNLPNKTDLKKTIIWYNKDGLKKTNKVFKKEVNGFYGNVQSDGSIKSVKTTYFYTAIEEGNTEYYVVRDDKGNRLGSRWTLRLILDMGFNQVE